MPDLLSLLAKRWKLILGLIFVATLLSLIISLLRPKEYLATATALPSNSATTDKARIFNNNIEALYPELGTPDELDKIEGTAKLDTLYLAVTVNFNLVQHYKMAEPSGVYKAAMLLKKNTDIRRSAYGELKIKVWDEDAAEAAQLANALVEKLNEIHQHLLNENNEQILSALNKEIADKQIKLDSIEQMIALSKLRSMDYSLDKQSANFNNDDSLLNHVTSLNNISKEQVRLSNEINQYQQLVSQYELSIKTNQRVLIIAERARPAATPDRPKVFQTMAFAFVSAFLFSFLLSLFIEVRKPKS